MRLALNNGLLMPGSRQEIALLSVGHVPAARSQGGRGDGRLVNARPVEGPEFLGRTSWNDAAPCGFASAQDRSAERVPGAHPVSSLIYSNPPPPRLFPGQTRT